jgi:hypothetical protein
MKTQTIATATMTAKTMICLFLVFLSLIVGVNAPGEENLLLLETSVEYQLRTLSINLFRRRRAPTEQSQQTSLDAEKGGDSNTRSSETTLEISSRYSMGPRFTEMIARLILYYDYPRLSTAEFRWYPARSGKHIAQAVVAAAQLQGSLSH